MVLSSIGTQKVLTFGSKKYIGVNNPKQFAINVEGCGGNGRGSDLEARETEEATSTLAIDLEDATIVAQVAVVVEATMTTAVAKEQTLVINVMDFRLVIMALGLVLALPQFEWVDWNIFA